MSKRQPCPCNPCPNEDCMNGTIRNPGFEDLRSQGFARDEIFLPSHIDCPTCQGTARVRPEITPERLEEISDDAGVDLTELGNAGGEHLALTGQAQKLLDWLWAVVDRQNEILCNVDPPPITDEQVEAAAKAHHETYEHLAPDYNYNTNVKTRVPWDGLPENNRLLMLASERAALEVARDLEEGT